MGGAQSGREEDEPGQDAAECRAEDVQPCADDKLRKNDVAGKSDAPLVEVNSIFEDDINDEDDEFSEKPPREVETLLENVVVNEESIKETEEEISLDMTEVKAKHNDINESFKTFFSKVGLKFTLKRGSRDHGEIGEGGPESTEVKNPAYQIQDDRTQVDIAHESQNDNSTCPTRGETKVLEDFQNEADSPDDEWTHIDMPSEREPSSLSGAKEDVTMSPIKKFFTTGIFAGLRKKSASLEDEIMTRELVVQEIGATAKEITYHQPEDTDNTVETVVDGDQEENPSTNIVSEPETPKDIGDVPSSPQKMLLLASSLMKLKRQKDTKPSEGEEYKTSSDSDHLLSPTDMAENNKNQSPAEKTVEEEESPWATFKKLLSPKKRVNRSALSNDVMQTLMAKDKSELSEGYDIECSVDEGKKRKDSAISWDAILCGSHTASDPVDETPSDNVNVVQAAQHFDNNGEVLASSTKGAGSPAEGDVGSAWNAFKRLMSPKRRAKPEEERQHSPETDDMQENISFSAKIFPTLKKRKSVSQKDQEAPSYEVDQELTPGDLNWPAVVPLSNYDTVEKEPKEETETSVKPDFQLNQDFLPEVTEAAQPLDNLATQETQHDVDALENEATYEDLADRTEFIGKPLSDIPEEGDLTESTTANDPIEITSKAVTAPESAYVSLGDDSKMISALSQLSEPTSGSTTAVLTECQVKETEEFLQQVVESISTKSEADSLCLNKMVCSASSDTLQTFGEDSQLREAQKWDVTTTRMDVVVNEMEAATDKTQTTEITPPIPTKELDTQGTTGAISTEELDTKEITTPIATEEFDTAEITPQIPLEDLDTKEITPQIPTEELEAQKIATPLPTEKLDPEEIKPTSIEELNTQEITIAIPPEKLDTEEIKPPTCTEEHDTDEIKPHILTDELETMEITAPFPDEEIDTKEITTLIPNKELDTQEITPPTPPEKLDTQEITTPIPPEKHDTEEITTVIPTKELDTREIAPPTPTEKLDTQEIMTPIPPEKLDTEEIKPIFTEECDTEEITPYIPTVELDTMEMTLLIPTKKLDTQEILIPPEKLDTEVITTVIPTKEPDIQEITSPTPTGKVDTEEIKPPTCTEEHDTEEIKPQILTDELETIKITTLIPNEIDTKEITTLIHTKELDTQEITTTIPPEKLDTEEITSQIPTEEFNTKEITTPIPSEKLDTEELKPTSTEGHDTKKIAPQVTTKGYDTKEVVTLIYTKELITTPSPTKDLDTKKIALPSLTEELDTQEITLPTEELHAKEITTLIPIKELDTEEITPPTLTEEHNTVEMTPFIPTEELDIKEIISSIIREEIRTTIQKEEVDTKEITPPILTEELNTQEIVPPIPTQELDTNKMTIPISTEELHTQVNRPLTLNEEHDKKIRPPIPTEELDVKEFSTPIPTKEHHTEEITPPIPTKDLDTEEIVPPIPSEKSETEEITPPVPTKELDTEEIVPPIPSEKSETEEITPPVPTKELDTEEIVPQIPSEKSETEEITPPVPTKELDTEEIVPLIPSEKSETEEITPPVPTKELDTEEIVPPIPSEKSETEEITPPLPTKELDTEEIVPPIPSEKSETEEITPPVPTKELDTEETVPPIPTEKSDTEEITPPIPTKELETEEIVPPIPSEKSETEEITPPVPTKELDTEEIVPQIPSEKSETEEITPPIPTKELETEEIVPPIPSEKSDSEEIAPPVPTKELDTEEIVPPIPSEKSETEEITPPVPTKELDTEEIVPQIPSEKSETEEITPPVPTKELDTEEIVPPIPSEKSETEEITPRVPTKELDTEEIVPPIPSEKSETKEITPPVPTKELDTEEIVPPIPSEKSETEEITPPLPTKELDTEEIVPPIPSEKSETEEITPPVPTKELDTEETVPPIPTEKSDTEEITPPIPTKELETEEIVPPIPSEKSETEEITPPVPTKELDTEEIVPQIPSEKSETEEITPRVPTKELDTEEIVPPIPSEKSETEEITPPVPTKELDTEEIVPPIPSEKSETEEITPPVPTKELDTEEIVPPIPKLDTEETVPPIPSEKSETEEITPPVPTKELDTEETVPPIPSEKSETEEITPPVPTKELDTEEIVPPIPSEKSETEEITPPVPTKELDTEEIVPPIPSEKSETEEITPPVPTKELDTEEIVPPIPSEKSETEEITPPVPTKELDTEEIVPPIPSEKSETEEITPPLPTKELDTEEIVPPIPSEKSETEEITPPVPTKELDTEEIVPPIPSEKSETEEITPPVPTKELDTEEIVPPIPSEKSETEEITPPVPTKELDTEEIVPPIPSEKSETEEITPPVPTKELDTEEIVPPIPSEKSETEEITPPVPTKELDTEEIVPPIPSEKSETEEITPPVPTKELDTEEIVPPIPSEKSETEEITPPVPTKELDTEEIVPPIPSEKSETEEITPPVPTKELDTEEIVPPIPSEKSETEEITPPLPTKELDTEEIVPPIPSEKSETEEITPPVPTKELDTEETVPPIPTEKSDTEEITPPIPTKELDTEETVPPISSEKADTEEITPSIPTKELNFEKSTPLIPTKELDTKEITPPILTEELGREKIVSPISSEKSDTEEITPPIPSKELDTEEIVPQILSGKSDTDEIRPSICTQELNFEESTPLIPTKELDTKEITPPIPKVELGREEIPPMTTEELHAEGITLPIPTQDLDSEEIKPSIPTQEFVTKEITQVHTKEPNTENMTADETHEDANLSKSDQILKELDSIDEIHEFVDCLTDINQAESSEMLAESKDVGTEDDLEDLAGNQSETEASKVDSEECVSMAEAERRDGGQRSLLEPVEQLQVEDQIPVVNELQSLRDVQEDITHLQENVTAETIIDEPEQETVACTELKETDAVQDFLPAVIIHLEEKEVKVTSENLPGGFKEDPKPTTEILSEASLDSVDVSEAQTDALPSEECSVQLAEDKILSAEVVSELKEATELLREVSVEPENKAVAKEPVDESEEPIQEIEDVQATQFESEKAGVLVEKLNEETVLLPEIEDKTMAAPEIEFVQEPQALVVAQERQFGSVTVDVQYADLEEHINEEEPPMEEVKEENVPLLQTNVEPEEKEQKSVSDSQIEHIKEEKDTRVEDMSVKPKEISEGIITEETMIAEFKDRPVPLTDHEPLSQDQKAKAELSPDQEVVQKSCQHKEIGEGTHPRGTMKEECEEETVTQLQTNIESAKDDKVEVHVSEIELVKEIEGTHPTQSTQTQSVDTEQAIVAEEKMTELKEETVCLTSVQPESGLKVVDVAKTEPNPEQAVVEEDEAITEDIAKERTVSVALKEEAVRLSEINVEPQDKDEEAVNETENIKAVKSEAFASEEGNEVIHQSEETTEGILVKVIPPGELKEEAEPLHEVTPGNEGKKQQTDLTEDDILPEKTTEDAQNEITKSSPETEALQSTSDLVRELEEDTVVAAETVEVAISRLGISEKSITRTLPKETLAEDIPKPETENEITSEGEKTKSQLDQALDKEEDPEPENTADDLPQVMEEEDGTPQVTEADVSSQQGETRCAQILEKVIYEEIPEFCGNLADQVKLEVDPSDIKTRIEGENCDRSDVEVTTATAEHAVVSQVTICDLKEVSTSPPDLIATPSAIREPLQGSVVTTSTETAVNEALLMTDDVAEMAKMGNEVMMMHVPATVIEDNHSIQVQVVQVDITLAERSVDQRLQVEIREKGVIDVCNASVEHVSASMGVEHVIHEDYTVIRHAVVPQVRETQPETFEQVVLIEAKEVELAKDDGNMEIPDKELAHKRENLAEASQREADTRSLEVPICQESLEETIGDLGKSEVTEDLRQTRSPNTVPQNISVESMSESEWEKEDGNWALEAEKPMAPTDDVQAPVVEEEPSSQTDSHEDTEPARKGPQTTVVEEPLPKREAVASQKEKDLTEEGVQSREPLSPTALNTEPTEESPQTPTAEEPLSQTVTQGPLSQLDPLDDLKTTQQSEVSVQALEKEKHISQIDKDDNLTKVSVLTPETKEHLPMLDTVVRHATLIKEGLQILVAEEILSELPPVVSYKETVATEVGILELDSVDLVHHKQTGISRQSVQPQETEESLCPKEPVESQTQAVQTKESHQAPKAEESISQKESTESQKQMALPEDHDLPHKDSTETQKRTEPPEEHFQLKKESSQTQKQTELLQKHVQARKIQESLAQKESTETQKETERTESSVQAPETENSPFSKEPADGQKQTVRIKETSEPARELDSMEITVSTDPPVLLDSGLQEAAEEILPVLAVEKLQPVETGEKIASKANEIPNIRGTDTFQTVQKPESEALVKEADDKQDIWVDAREDLEFQEETDQLPSQDENSRHDCKPETKTAHEEESEMVPIPEPEAESNNEDEHFAVALDDPKTESVAVIEWD
ncbi:titin [Phyllopteryx taeniolatus]|uniref:titin n=1 Tax=Phyllopteryx taeniolatus TaxID=161469 RepID=UPI002AD3BFD3|nr:titin [Phyllopteryx taeniolatus]